MSEKDRLDLTNREVLELYQGHRVVKKTERGQGIEIVPSGADAEFGKQEH